MSLEVMERTRLDADDPPASLTLTIVVKEVREEGLAPYFVTQCVELPGCVSEGDTEDEARSSIQSAMRACLSVMFEDSTLEHRARFDAL